MEHTINHRPSIASESNNTSAESHNNDSNMNDSTEISTTVISSSGSTGDIVNTKVIKGADSVNERNNRQKIHIDIQNKDGNTISKELQMDDDMDMDMEVEMEMELETDTETETETEIDQEDLAHIHNSTFKRYNEAQGSFFNDTIDRCATGSGKNKQVKKKTVFKTQKIKKFKSHSEPFLLKPMNKSNPQFLQHHLNVNYNNNNNMNNNDKNNFLQAVDSKNTPFALTSGIRSVNEPSRVEESIQRETNQHTTFSKGGNNSLVDLPLYLNNQIINRNKNINDGEDENNANQKNTHLVKNIHSGIVHVTPDPLQVLKSQQRHTQAILQAQAQQQQQQQLQMQMQMQWAHGHMNSNPSVSSLYNNSNSSLSRFQKNNTQIIVPTIEDSLDKRIRYVLYLQSSFESPPLPPINLGCLKEIDLNEIIKNPQLRHDIIFDPLLQFRPNLDGERGLRKKNKADKYWNDVLLEISIIYEQDSKIEQSVLLKDFLKHFNKDKTLLIPLFQSLKDVLISIIPKKDSENVNLIMDIDLMLQEFLKKSINLTNFSTWLTTIFKNQCAPMRDSWVDQIHKNFIKADKSKDKKMLIDALKSTFQLLEAMKLDIANHQIRMLRPALISNSVEFERQYFASLLKSKKIDQKQSISWIQFEDTDSTSLNIENENTAQGTENPPKTVGKISIPDFYKKFVQNVLRLLSCKKMVKEYPITLSFDHTRLSLLRADIRQIVCLLIVRFLFKQLIGNEKNMSSEERIYILKNFTNKNLRDDILSMILDSHGNCRWTKNTMSIAIHLVKKIHDLRSSYNESISTFAAAASLSNVGNTKENIAKEKMDLTTQSVNATIDNYKIEFAKNWLSKQTQPSSEVYGVLEKRVLENLLQTIVKKSNCSTDGLVNQDFMHLVETGLIDNNDAASLNTKNINNKNILASPAKTTAPNSKINLMNIPTATSGQNNSNSRNISQTEKQVNSFDLEEFDSLSTNLYIVINLHWSVFGSHYIDFLSDKIDLD